MHKKLAAITILFLPIFDDSLPGVDVGTEIIFSVLKREIETVRALSLPHLKKKTSYKKIKKST
jgi:hypothetical protein